MSGHRRGWMVDVVRGIAGPAEFEDSLQEYHRLVGCDCIDIVLRYIEGVPFCIVVDDEGLMKDSPRISAIGDDGRPALVGNLVILAPGIGGDMRSLDGDEEEVLRRNCAMYIMRRPDGISYNVMALSGLSRRPMPITLWTDEDEKVEA